jgi:hypothetical protein
VTDPARRAGAGLLLILAFSLQACSSVQIKDLSKYKTSQPAVQNMLDMGVMKLAADGTFNPDGAVTRAEFAGYLAKLYKLTPPSVKWGFTDVNAADEGAVQAAFLYLEPHLTCPGCALDGRFFPDRPISKVEAAAAVVKILIDRGHIQPLTRRERAGLDNDPSLKDVLPAAKPFAALAKKNKLPDVGWNGRKPIKRVGSAVLLDFAQKTYGTKPKKLPAKKSIGGGGLHVPISTELTGNDHPQLGFGITFDGGPIIENPKVYLIFWHPGVRLDPNAPDDSAYIAAMKLFFTSAAGTPYFNIVTQYAGCQGPPPCHPGFPVNPPGGNFLAGSDEDVTTPYPQTTVYDADIQNEIKAEMAKNTWTQDPNNIFVVFLGASVAQCNNSGMSSCAGSGYCAIHGAFSATGSSDLSVNPVPYIVMPQGDSLGCTQFIPTPLPGSDLAIDREHVALSHEFLEAVTDPLVAINPNGITQNPGWGPGEIGDICDFQPNFQKSSKATLNGTEFWVQPVWDQDHVLCATQYGPTAQIVIGNGPSAPRLDSAVLGKLENSQPTPIDTEKLKLENIAAWLPNDGYGFVWQIDYPTPFDVTKVDLNLISYSSPPDTWSLVSLSTKIFDPTGRQMCGSAQNGTPLYSFSGNNTSASYPVTCCTDPATPLCATGPGAGQCLDLASCTCLEQGNCPSCPASTPMCNFGPGKGKCLAKDTCYCLLYGNCKVGGGGGGGSNNSLCEPNWATIGCPEPPKTCPSGKLAVFNLMNCTCFCPK